MRNIFKTKPIDIILKEAQGNDNNQASLKKTLNAYELIMFGIGVVIGTGIFVLTGVAAAQYSGPALIISFAIAGLSCVFAGLCYAEFAAMVPVAGSAYTYSYAALGEIWAWIIGWDLILEYIVAIPAVAIGWSGYITSLLKAVGIHIPDIFTNSPGANGGIINLPAVLIILLISLLLMKGVKESSRINNIMVIIKVSVILFFILVGVFHIKPSNWTPFMPFGLSGIFRGAAFVFFSFIGFDSISTAAEEVKNPQKDLPKGIIGSLLICTLLYIAVSGVLTGILPYEEFKNTSAPVAYALAQIGISWGSALVSVGAISGITTVLMVMIYAQTRIFFVMSRDGLLPEVFKEVSKTHGTPVKSTIIVAIITAILAGFTPITAVAELTNIGTLAAFIIVSVSIIVLRKRNPDIERPFKCPWVPAIPLLSIAFCSYLLLSLSRETHIRFLIWIGIGIIIYFLYSRKHSKLNVNEEGS